MAHSEVETRNSVRNIYVKLQLLKPGDEIILTRVHVELPIPSDVRNARNSECSQVSIEGNVIVEMGGTSQVEVLRYTFRGGKGRYCVVNTGAWNCNERYAYAELRDNEGRQVRVSPLED